MEVMSEKMASQLHPSMLEMNDSAPALQPKKRFGIPKRGTDDRRIIRVENRGGRRWELHATKGWRNYRLA